MRVVGTEYPVYLGLGSNSDDAETKLDEAIFRIGNLPAVKVTHVSSRYYTEPQGFAQQPWFTNQVVAIDAGQQWSPDRLLRECLVLETSLGRVRDPANRFGPRKIDIDLLLFGTVQSSNPDCLLPHPRMLQRAFVLVPLAEIAPQLSIDGVPIANWLQKISYRLIGKKIYQ